MTAVRVIIAFLVIGVMGLLWAQNKQIGLQEYLITSQATAIDTAIDSLQSIKTINESNRESMVQLLAMQTQIKGSLSARTTEIRRLQTDVEEIRKWADGPLPDDIKRMRNRPALTGAGTYGAAMSASNPVHADGVQSENKR